LKEIKDQVMIPGAMNQNPPVQVLAEATPNPGSMKFSINKEIASESYQVSDISQAGRSPLAQKIMGFPWAKNVLIGNNFVSITKEDWVEWDIIVEPLAQMIQEHIQNGHAVLYPDMSHRESAHMLNGTQEGGIPRQNTLQNNQNKDTQGANVSPDSQDIAHKIQTLIENNIQPAVAMDGGHVVFVGYEKGTVFLKMQGACAGCPSASMTLKQGIETHLKQHIPEVQQVVSV